MKIDPVESYRKVPAFVTDIGSGSKLAVAVTVSNLSRRAMISAGLKRGEYRFLTG